MNLVKNHKNTNIFCIMLFFCLLLALSLLINSLYPVTGDDLFFIYTPSPSLNATLHWTLSQTQWIFLHWSGRLATYLVQYLTFFSIEFRNILNAIAFSLLIYGAFLNIKQRHPKYLADVFTLLLITLCVWTFNSGFAETMVLKNGSIYTYFFAPTLFFITYPFLKLIENQDILSGGIIKFIFLNLMAFLLAQTTENLAISMIVLMGLTCLMYTLKNKKIHYLAVGMLFSYTAGFLLTIFAPGNYERFKYYGGQHYLTGIDLKHHFKFIEQLIYHFINDYTPHVLFPLFTLIIPTFAAILLLKLYRKKIPFKRFFVFLGLSLLSALSLITLPETFGLPGRVVMYTDLFYVMACLVILSELQTLGVWRFVYFAAIMMFFITLLPSFTNYYRDLKNIHQQDLFRTHLINVFGNNHKNFLLLPALNLYSLDLTTFRQDSHIDSQYLFFVDYGYQVDNMSNSNLLRIYPNFKKLIFKPYIYLWEDLEKKLGPFNDKKFKVFIENNTTYLVSTKGSCETLKDSNNFFVKLYPEKLRYLSNIDKLKGYAYKTFGWEEQHIVTLLDASAEQKNDICVLAFNLPSYPVKKIEVGQYSGLDFQQGKIIWSNEQRNF